jgi:hypothetical protein
VIEHVLQRQVLAHLHQLPRCFFWRANTGSARRGSQVVRFGLPGQSDILGTAAGRFVAIELKTDVGRQSAEQRTFQASVERGGGLYILARSLDDALNPIRELLR